MAFEYQSFAFPQRSKYKSSDAWVDEVYKRNKSKIDSIIESKSKGGVTYEDFDPKQAFKEKIANKLSHGGTVEQATKSVLHSQYFTDQEQVAVENLFKGVFGTDRNIETGKFEKNPYLEKFKHDTGFKSAKQAMKEGRIQYIGDQQYRFMGYDGEAWIIDVENSPTSVSWHPVGDVSHMTFI